MSEEGCQCAVLLAGGADNCTCGSDFVGGGVVLSSRLGAAPVVIWGGGCRPKGAEVGDSGQGMEEM